MTGTNALTWGIGMFANITIATIATRVAKARNANLRSRTFAGNAVITIGKSSTPVPAGGSSTEVFRIRLHSWTPDLHLNHGGRHGGSRDRLNFATVKSY